MSVALFCLCSCSFKCVCIYADTKKTATQRIQRNWWFTTIQVWRLRSSSVSSTIPRPLHISWTPQSWLSNRTRNRYCGVVYHCSNNQTDILLAYIYIYSWYSVLLGVDSVGLPNKTRTNEGQCSVLYQGQSRGYYNQPLLLGCAARTGAGNQTFAIQQDIAAQVFEWLWIRTHKRLFWKFFYKSFL